MGRASDDTRPRSCTGTCARGPEPRGRLQRRRPGAPASASPSLAVPSSPCSEPTAPERPPSCAPSPACSMCTGARSPRARSPSTARTSPPLRRRQRPGRRVAGDGGSPHLRRAHRRREPSRSAPTPAGTGEVATSYERVIDLFPVLKERRRLTAGYLSGGEQQMVAIGRALMASPTLLLLDEPSLGLAPKIVEQIRGDHRQHQRAGHQRPARRAERHHGAVDRPPRLCARARPSRQGRHRRRPARRQGTSRSSTSESARPGASRSATSRPTGARSRGGRDGGHRCSRSTRSDAALRRRHRPRRLVRGRARRAVRRHRAQRRRQDLDLQLPVGVYRPQSGRDQPRRHRPDRAEAEPHGGASASAARSRTSACSPTSTVIDNLLLGRHHLMRTGVRVGRHVVGPGQARRARSTAGGGRGDRRPARADPTATASVGLLPYGVQKRIELGRALAMEPKLLLLDEPVAGMNLEETEDMARFILEIRDGLHLLDDPRRARHAHGDGPRRSGDGARLRRPHRHRHARRDPERSASSTPTSGAVLRDRGHGSRHDAARAAAAPSRTTPTRWRCGQAARRWKPLHVGHTTPSGPASIGLGLRSASAPATGWRSTREPAGLGAGRPRHPGPRRRDRRDLPHLPGRRGGVPPQPLRGRSSSSPRTRSRSTRRWRSGTRCPTAAPVVVIDPRGVDLDDDWLITLAELEEPRAPSRPTSASPTEGLQASTTTPPRRSSTRRAPPARPRGRCSATATWCRPPPAAPRFKVTERDEILELPAAVPHRREADLGDQRPGLRLRRQLRRGARHVPRGPPRGAAHLLPRRPAVWEKLLAGITIKMADASRLKQGQLPVLDAAGRALAPSACGRHVGPVDRGRRLRRLALPVPEPAGEDRHGPGARPPCPAPPPSPAGARVLLGLGVPVREGYGQTENTAQATLTPTGDVRLGTVGTPVPGAEVRIADDGEILTRGPGTFLGYYRNERPRDDRRRRVAPHRRRRRARRRRLPRITDRKKDIIITAGGKNISPSEIENRLKVSPFVQEAIVIGDRRKYLTALIGIEQDTVSNWASPAASPSPPTPTCRPSPRWSSSCSRSSTRSTPSSPRSRPSSASPCSTRSSTRRTAR